MLKTVFLTTALIGAGLLTAAAQPSSSPGMSPSGTMNKPATPGSSPSMNSNTNASVSPSTHCKTASGQVHMKSAGTTGSAISNSPAIQGVSPSVVATLPSC
jgi:hypothetical protein